MKTPQPNLDPPDWEDQPLLELSPEVRLAYLVQISAGIIASGTKLQSSTGGFVDASDGEYYARALTLLAEKFLEHLVNRVENT